MQEESERKERKDCMKGGEACEKQGKARDALK